MNKIGEQEALYADLKVFSDTANGEWPANPK
jgi:hypothetical protein